MRLSEICIDRPVLSIAMSLAIVAFGAISLSRLPNRELPDVDLPVVSVITVLRGAAAEVVETSVTDVLEDELIGIAGMEHLTSESREGASLIDVRFKASEDIDFVAAEVRDRVARVRGMLPDDVEEPVVSKMDFESFGGLYLGLAGGGLSNRELTSLAESHILDRFSKLPGVSRVMVEGERRFAVRIWLDRDRLTARGLTVNDVSEALRRENVDLPSGRIESAGQEFSVRTSGELRSAAEYGALIVANVAGQPVRIRDVGRAEIGSEHERAITRLNGLPGIVLRVDKQSMANVLDVARNVKLEAKRIQPTLPAGVEISIEYDLSRFVEQSINDVRTTIFYAIGFVLIVVFIFLRSWRATIIPALAIPISIIGCFSIVYFAGYTVNTLTLMGVTLAIGLVVDDAIVVLENISRWIEQGNSRREAARRGMNEISFAVVAASVSVMAVFLPLTFLTDQTGRLFREFGVTVVAAVGISGFVALTLAPALCARILTPSADRGDARDFGGLDVVRESYRRILDRVMKRPWLPVVAAAIWLGIGGLLLATLGRELAPAADRGQFSVMTRAPEGSSIDYLDRYQLEVEKILLDLPEIESLISIVGMTNIGPPLVTEGIEFATLVRPEERERTQQEIIEALYAELAQVTGIDAFPVGEPTLSFDYAASPISLVVQGPDLRQVAALADEIVDRSRAIPGIVNLQSDLRLTKPQLRVDIDRERASDLGVSVRDIASTLQILVGGLDLSTFKLRGETYDVIARLEETQRSTPQDLYGLYVRASTGRLVPLDSLVHVEESIAPPRVRHFDRLRSATLQGQLVGGLALGDALTQIQRIADEVIPPGGSYRILFTGESERFFDSSQSLLFAYIFAIALIYLVLAAQFESFIHPVTILVSTALAFPGALLTLWLAGTTLNLFSQIGLVMLIGLVTKNSILIVEFANRLREQGVEASEAVQTAAYTRFRPILMTALSTIAGILPIALGLGAGGEARAPLGLAVVGGLGFATLLTFFVVPPVYLGFARLEMRLKGGASAAIGEAS